MNSVLQTIMTSYKSKDLKLVYNKKEASFFPVIQSKFCKYKNQEGYITENSPLIDLIKDFIVRNKDKLNQTDLNSVKKLMNKKVKIITNKHSGIFYRIFAFLYRSSRRREETLKNQMLALTDAIDKPFEPKKEDLVNNPKLPNDQNNNKKSASSNLHNKIPASNLPRSFSDTNQSSNQLITNNNNNNNNNNNSVISNIPPPPLPGVMSEQLLEGEPKTPELINSSLEIDLKNNKEKIETYIKSLSKFLKKPQQIINRHSELVSFYSIDQLEQNQAIVASQICKDTLALAIQSMEEKSSFLFPFVCGKTDGIIEFIYVEPKDKSHSEIILEDNIDYEEENDEDDLIIPEQSIYKSSKNNFKNLMTCPEDSPRLLLTGFTITETSPPSDSPTQDRSELKKQFLNKSNLSDIMSDTTNKSQSEFDCKSSTNEKIYTVQDFIKTCDLYIDGLKNDIANLQIKLDEYQKEIDSIEEKSYFNDLNFTQFKQAIDKRDIKEKTWKRKLISIEKELIKLTPPEQPLININRTTPSTPLNTTDMSMEGLSSTEKKIKKHKKDINKLSANVFIALKQMGLEPDEGYNVDSFNNTILKFFKNKK